jgi:hypothetical protein
LLVQRATLTGIVVFHYDGRAAEVTLVMVG